MKSQEIKKNGYNIEFLYKIYRLNQLILREDWISLYDAKKLNKNIDKIIKILEKYSNEIERNCD